MIFTMQLSYHSSGDILFNIIVFNITLKLLSDIAKITLAIIKMSATHQFIS